MPPGRWPLDVILGVGVPEVVIVKVSSTPCGKITLESLVKLGAVSADKGGAAATSTRIATATRANLGIARDKNSMSGKRRQWCINMA